MAMQVGNSSSQTGTEVLRDIFQNLLQLKDGQSLTIKVRSQDGNGANPNYRLYEYSIESSDAEQYIVVENPAFIVSVLPAEHQ